MNTIRSHLSLATSELLQSGIASAALDTKILMAYVLRMPREQLVFDAERTLQPDELSAFNAAIARRAHYEPVAYITGSKEFWSLDFYVTRDTLIPRPDSETLVEAALKRMRSKTSKGGASKSQARPITILDIGTGTGCLLIALLKELPEARGVGADNSERALQVARENAKRHGVDPRAEFTLSHWSDAIYGTFDLILSNPPYITTGAMAALMPDVVRFEPESALVAGTDGLDAYRALAPRVAQKLNAGGYAVFEVGQGQEDGVARLLEAQELEIDRFEADLAGINRCVVARKHH